jgi:hypothetical protein
MNPDGTGMDRVQVLRVTFTSLACHAPVMGDCGCSGTAPRILQVMESWRAILCNVRPGAFKVKLEDVRVFAREDMGFVTCVEIINADDSMGRCGRGHVSLARLGWMPWRGVALFEVGPRRRRWKFSKMPGTCFKCGAVGPPGLVVVRR